MFTDTKQKFTDTKRNPYVYSLHNGNIYAGGGRGVSESRSMTGVTPMTTFFTKDPLCTTAVELSETRADRTSESTANPLVL